MDEIRLKEKIDKLAEDYKAHGFGVIENFLSSDEVENLRRESTKLIESTDSKDYKKYIFGNEFNQKSEYFINSGDKIRHFFEKGAINKESGELCVPKEQSIAKFGHALHCLNPTFRQVSSSKKVRDVFKALGFANPTIVQSMVIFKNPKVGGEYTPHQDASFLCTEPIRLAGLWLALDDATPENGCLQFIPGSHTNSLARRFVRVEKGGSDGELIQWTAPVKEYDEDKFILSPVKKGSLVVIHGLVVHRSSPNNSDKARWAYTFHAYDKAEATYLKDNWLQEIDNKTFTELGG